MTARPSRTQTMLMLAQVFAERGTCPRAKVGAVIATKNGRVISHGYNGAPEGMPHCDDVKCGRDYVIHAHNWTAASQKDVIQEQGCTNAVHAEANAITYAAKVGVPTDGALMYCTHEPCLRCANLIIQAGIDYVYYLTPYDREPGSDRLKVAGIGVEEWRQGWGDKEWSIDPKYQVIVVA